MEGESDGHVRGPVPDAGSLSGPVTHRGDPQAVYATESLAQTLPSWKPTAVGLPVLSDDGQQVEGRITNASVRQAVAGELGSAVAKAGRARGTEASETGRGTADAAPPTPLPGHQVLEISVSPARWRRG